MKALIVTAAGVLGLGGLLVATSGRTTSAQSVVAEQASSLTADRPTLINCGEGRQAVVFPRADGLSQVECVAPQGAGVVPAGSYAQQAVPSIVGNPMALGYADARPVTVAAPVHTRTVVEERVVYRDRPATRTRTRAARSSAPAYRAASAPAYRSEEPARRTRTWKKSAVIIGGATAGGAGVGALLGGKSGAKKGAVAGLVGGTVYDIATRNK